MNERKNLLQQKLKINKQKNQKKMIIQLLPKNLSNVIENSDFITSPAVEKILETVHNKWNNELHSHSFINHYKDFRKEFSWEQEVIQYVEEIDIEEKHVYLLLGILDGPLFLVDGNWVIQNFKALWESLDYEDIWMISQNFKYGVLVSRYLGYLEHDPNPREILYAVTKWDD